MIILVKQLILKYQFLKHDLIEKEKFHEAKIVKDILADLMKLHDLEEKQHGR